MKNKKVIIFGSGYMAEEYLKVLKALDCEVSVVGRNGEKAKGLAQRYSCAGYGGGSRALKDIECGNADLAIISSSVESLKDLTIDCIGSGIKNILIEKPGALDIIELEAMSKAVRPDNNIAVAYNRRSYNSVIQLKSAIEKDGGPLGCFFDFTDREKDVLDNPKSKDVIKRWGFGNSSHVIDTAFYLVGGPVEMSSLRSGSWDCHPTGTAFAGSGRTEKCLFSYFATWAGGGRWDIEISTKEGRYKLSPLEELQFCKKNQFAWEKIALQDDDDTRFKPGLYKMVKKVLLDKDFSGLPTIADQIRFCGTVDRIFGYEK